MLFTLHHYHGVALFHVGEDVEEGEWPAEAEEEAEVAVPPVPDWLQYRCVAWSEPLCLFPIYRARAAYEHQIFFQRTHRTDS